jgi:hypothetical protein
MVVTEDLGKIFEKAICILYKTEYSSNYKYSIPEAIKLAERLIKLKDLVPYNLLHIAENRNKYDFQVIENNTYLSAKTTKKDGKICPQVIGQPTKKTFCEYFKLDINITLDQIKDHIQINNKYLLKEYSDNTFNCPVIYYNKHKNNLLYICLIKEIEWDQYNIVFSHIIKNKKWNESSTISINNKSIGEYQIHNHRNCIKFRWSFENILILFKDHFTINEL